MAKRLIFVRHGHTVNNSNDHKTNRMMGWVNDVAGLSEEGRVDARSTASKLRNYQIDVAYHSDLLRTTETASIISSELTIKIEPTHYLRERNLGNFADCTAHDLITSRPHDWEKFLDHADQDWNGLAGESLRQVNARFAKFHQQLISQHPHQTVLLVTHSGILHTILRDYFHFFPVESFIEVGHDSITVVDNIDGNHQLTLHNG